MVFMKMSRVAILVLGIATVLLTFVPTLSWAAEDGAGLYKAKCAACHGADAAGKPAMKAPAVRGLDEGAVKKGLDGPKHTALKKALSDEQVKAIAAYLQTLK